MPLPFLTSPALSAIPGIGHGFFTRQGGVSEGVYGSLNCGWGSKDKRDRIVRNRALVAEALGARELMTAYQVHSTTIHHVDRPFAGRPPERGALGARKLDNHGVPGKEEAEEPGRVPAGRLIFGVLAAGMIRALPPPGPTDSVLPLLATRWREILPPNEFDVMQEGLSLVVTAVDPGGEWRGAFSAGSLLELRIPVSRSLRLKIYFENQARELQEFVSKHRQHPWPSRGAASHVLVTQDEIRVWYGPSDETRADLRWRPIQRSVLGL